MTPLPGRVSIDLQSESPSTEREERKFKPVSILDSLQPSKSLTPYEDVHQYGDG